MTLKERIEVLDQLGKRLIEGDEYLDAVIHRTFFNNKWFTKENQHRTIKGIATGFLQKEKLEKWVNQYNIADLPSGKTIAIIPTDNIPLATFHDVLCCFIAGHRSKIKLPENDQYLLPCLLKFLKETDNRTDNFFQIIQKLDGFDAAIVSDNKKSTGAFAKYFAKKPNIIRKRRGSAAVLSGTESDVELLKLGDDIFNNFGQDDRNVSKVYLPKDYDLKKLLEVLHEFKELVLNDKYKSNFDYNFALYSLNKIPFHMNGCMLLVEDESIQSRTTCLNYELYEDMKGVEAALSEKADEIHHIVASEELLNLKTIPFGKTQQPKLDDYLGKEDTMAFLTSI